MAEIKKLWITHDFRGDMGSLLETTKGDHEWLLGHFCAGLDEGGLSFQKFMDIAFGTGAVNFAKEKTRAWDNEADARKDAEKRLAKAQKKHEAKGGKEASDNVIASRIAFQFTKG